MIPKFCEALSLLRRHIGLFAAMILTVWLPGNIVITYLAYSVEGLSNMGYLALVMVIQGTFGPIYIGALVYCVFQMKSGRAVTYREAMAVGIKKWPALFTARLVAGVLISAAYLALVTPGVVLDLRYALLDSAVIIERKCTSEALVRSRELMDGRRWQMFWAAAVFFTLYVIVSVAVSLPLDFIDSPSTMPVEVVLKCALDIAFAVIQIVICLVYWEAIQQEKHFETCPGGPLVLRVPARRWGSRDARRESE